MKKLIGFFILVSITSCSTVPQSQRVEEVQPGFVILDVLLYRPVGLIATVIGTGAFIGMSPLTALASIPAPHDAFVKTGKILILSPASYTFIRPVGDRSFPYNLPQYKHRPIARQNNVEPYKNAVIPKQRPVTPTVPYAQPPLRYPDTGKGL
jgi:hypothetical protein